MHKKTLDKKVKIVTWNVNSIRVRMPLLLSLIEEESPDVILLQEIKCENDKFPSESFESLHYNVLCHGQKSNNGVAILSKFTIDSYKTDFFQNPVPSQSRFLEAELTLPIGCSRIISVYVPNGGEVDSDSYNQKLEFLSTLSVYLQSLKKPDEFLLVGGDFNVAAEEIDVDTPEKYQDQTCFTLRERRAMRAVLNSGMCDLYRLANPKKKEFSWWDYRGSSFKKNQGMRIDTIISSCNVTKHKIECVIQKKWRAMESPSDHVPVILEVTVP